MTEKKLYQRLPTKNKIMLLLQWDEDMKQEDQKNEEKIQKLIKEEQQKKQKRKTEKKKESSSQKSKKEGAGEQDREGRGSIFSEDEYRPSFLDEPSSSSQKNKGKQLKKQSSMDLYESLKAMYRPQLSAKPV